MAIHVGSITVQALLASMRLLLLLFLSFHVAAANDPGPAIMQLGFLFIEESVETLSSTCSARFAESKPLWAAAVKEWKASNAVALEELRALSQQVEADARQQATESQLVAFRSQAEMLPLIALASTRDAEAAQLCARSRSELADAKINAQSFRSAKAAATAFMSSRVR